MGVNIKYTARPSKWNEDKDQILMDNLNLKNELIAEMCNVSVPTVQKRKAIIKKKIEEQARKSKFKLNNQYSNINQDKILERADEIIKQYAKAI
jgi:hypothetical protein